MPSPADRPTSAPARRRERPAVRSRSRRLLRWLVRLRGSPEAIGRGVAIGVVVAFTPTLGIQTPLALLLATCLGGNRSVSLVPVWITNPATAVPVYGATYWLGSRFWPGSPAARVRELLRELAGALGAGDAWSAPLEAFAAAGRDVWIALWIGGLLVGGLAALPAYYGTVAFVTRARARLRKRRERRRRSGPALR